MSDAFPVSVTEFALFTPIMLIAYGEVLSHITFPDVVCVINSPSLPEESLYPLILIDTFPSGIVLSQVTVASICFLSVVPVL